MTRTLLTVPVVTVLLAEFPGFELQPDCLLKAQMKKREASSSTSQVRRQLSFVESAAAVTNSSVQAERGTV